jgi:hypothetical protein
MRNNRERQPDTPGYPAFYMQEKRANELTLPDLQYGTAMYSNKSVEKLIPKNTQKNVVLAKPSGFDIGNNNCITCVYHAVSHNYLPKL